MSEEEALDPFEAMFADNPDVQELDKELYVTGVMEEMENQSRLIEEVRVFAEGLMESNPVSGPKQAALTIGRCIILLGKLTESIMKVKYAIAGEFTPDGMVINWSQFDDMEGLLNRFIESGGDPDVLNGDN